MYKTIDEIKTANKNLGHHFFENEWFSKVADPTVYAGRYFITEDYLRIGTIEVPSRFTIRRADPDGGISTVGEYVEYESLTQAQTVAKGLTWDS